MCRKIILFLLFVTIFSACNPSKKDIAEINDILDIRITAMNKHDKKAIFYVLDETYPDKNEFMKQFQMQTLYFEELEYDLLDRFIVEYSPISSVAEVEQKYNLKYKIPNKEEVVLKNKKEKITLKKGEHGWKIIGGLSPKKKR